MANSYKFSDYKSWTHGRLGDPAFNDALLSQFASDTNREICNSRRWPFMEDTYPGSIEQGDSACDFPVDLQLPINLTVIDPNNRARHLRYVDYNQFDD